MRVKILLIVCSFLNFTNSKFGSSQITDTNSINITNYHIKTTNASDLLNLDKQDAFNSGVKQTLIRGITPTGNEHFNSQTTDGTLTANSSENGVSLPPTNLTTVKANTNVTKTIVSTVPSKTANNSNAITTKITPTSSMASTTTTSKPKPKKPLVTFSFEDFPELDEDRSIGMPVPETAPIRELPNVLPSQEFNSSFSDRHGRDYILPVMAIIFIIPLTIGVVITAYRRFKDFWSTRHYRRMDFLVDGMYND